jgi:hypothetical protein
MRRLISISLLFLFCGRVMATPSPSWQDDYGALLRKYASPAGVNYALWKKSPEDLARLEAIIRVVQKQPVTGKATPEEKAFLINAYNLWTLHGVLQAYPVPSVKDIAPEFGFFSQDRIHINSQKTSLNTLEKKMLLQTYADPRIHFAVNCASRSCPPLLAEPYVAGKLESQLDGATRAFLRENPEALQISPDRKSWRISSLFDWYAPDFAPAGGALAFIQKFRTDPVPHPVKPTFLPYDWSLNEIR